MEKDRRDMVRAGTSDWHNEIHSFKGDFSVYKSSTHFGDVPALTRSRLSFHDSIHATVALDHSHLTED